MKVKLILERATLEMRIKGERYRKVIEVEIPDTDNSQAEEKGVWQIVGYVEGDRKMKDEEMAEEYLQSIEGDDCVIITDREERKQAFLAGLKAGRQDDQLTKATEIIKVLIALHYNPIVNKDDLKKQDKILEQAEQFIKEKE